MLRNYLKNAAVCLVAIVASALLLEFGLRVAAQVGWIEIDINPLNGFWADMNPDFGVWHRSNASQTFGPVQYLLVYETLAKKFAHDVVLVGFLPENDFTDSNWEIGQKAFYNRYRPYFVGADGNYELVHFNKAYFDVPQTSSDWLESPFLYLWNNTLTLRA